MKLLLAILLLAGPALAYPTPRAEWETIDAGRMLARNIPPIVQRILSVAQTYRPAVIQFGSSEGASKMAFSNDWDIFRFKFGQGTGGLIVLLSEADELALLRYFSAPECVGKRVAAEVRKNGPRAIAQMWGIPVQWGTPEKQEDPEELELPRR